MYLCSYYSSDYFILDIYFVYINRYRIDIEEKRRDIYIENARLSAFSRHFKRHEPSTAHQSINDPYAAKAIIKASEIKPLGPFSPFTPFGPLTLIKIKRTAV